MGIDGTFLLTIGTQTTHQTLGNDAHCRVGDQIALHTHIQQTGNGRSGIIGMQGADHQVAGNRSLDGDGCGFAVTNLTDHDNIRVLTKDGTKAVGEGQLRFNVDLHLVDALDIGFHRVFNGNDVDGVVIQFAQSSVQCGGLTGTGGAGDQHDAVGMSQNPVELYQVIGRKAQGALAAAKSLLLVQSENTLFTIDGGQGGYTDIIFPAVNSGSKAAVLGFSLFGNIQTGYDLDTGYDGRQQTQAVIGSGIEHAVDTAADTDTVRLCFHVNIGCSLAHGLLHQGVDQHDHRGRVDILTDDLIFNRGIDLTVTGVKLSGFPHFIGAVIAVDIHQDVTGSCQVRLNTALAGDSNDIPATHIHGIVHSHQQRTRVIGIKAEGHYHVIAQKLGLYQLTDLCRNLLLVKTDDRQSGYGSQRLQQMVFRHGALLRNQFTDAAAIFQMFIM